MLSRNLLLLTGNVGQDPRQVGKTVKVNVATNRYWTDAEGKKQTPTDWVTVTFFEGKLASSILARVHKGDRVSIEARVADSSYTDKAGNTIYSTDVIGERLDRIDTSGTGSEE